MKIAVISGSDISQDNGISVRAKRIYKILKRDHDTVILYSHQKDFRNLLSIFLNNLIWNLRLLYLIPRQKVDAVYVSNDFLGFLSVYILSKLMKFKIIFEVHGTMSEENINKNRGKIIITTAEFIEKFAITNSDYVIALSQNIFRFYRKYNQNIALVPVFIDESIKFDIKTPNNNGYKSIGVIGPFDMPANEYYLDFVYDNLNKFDHNIVFYIIGSCNHVIESDKIKYTGYINSYSEYLSLISSLDLVLVPSKISTSGPLNKILEAMLCSTPVITTSKGVYGLDNIKNQENILIFNEDEIVKQVNKNIYNENLLKKIGTNAAEIIKNYYSKEINEKKILSTVDSLTGK